MGKESTVTSNTDSKQRLLTYFFKVKEIENSMASTAVSI
jgi:hypothetical protein